MENLLLGLLSGLVALLISQVGSLIVCRKGLDMGYNGYPAESILLVLGTTLLVVCVGMAASIPVLRQKPVSFLREQSEE